MVGSTDRSRPNERSLDGREVIRPELHHQAPSFGVSGILENAPLPFLKLFLGVDWRSNGQDPRHRALEAHKKSS
jgi:hypothetical protein